MTFASALNWFHSPQENDPYAILNISRKADNDTIRRSYQKMAMQHHPDLGGSNDKIIQINTAYSIIRKKRGL